MPIYKVKARVTITREIDMPVAAENEAAAITYVNTADDCKECSSVGGSYSHPYYDPEAEIMLVAKTAIIATDEYEGSCRPWNTDELSPTIDDLKAEGLL